MSAAKQLKIDVLVNHKKAPEGVAKRVSQNYTPEVLKGKSLRNVALPPHLAKILAKSKPITGPVKATNLTEALTMLRGRKTQVG